MKRLLWRWAAIYLLCLSTFSLLFSDVSLADNIRRDKTGAKETALAELALTKTATEKKSTNKATNKPAPKQVNLEITTHLGDQQQFIEGDVISFFINVDQPVYLYAFYQDAAGQLYQLIPSKVQPLHYFQPGYYLAFPAENAKFKFVVQPPFGKEQVWLFASDNAALTFKGKLSTQGIRQLSLAKPHLQKIADIIKDASGLYGMAQLTFSTSKRK